MMRWHRPPPATATSCHEAHLPAQEAQARTHATAFVSGCRRSPAAWSSSAAAPRAQEAHGLIAAARGPGLPDALGCRTSTSRCHAFQPRPSAPRTPVAQRRVRARIPPGPLARQPPFVVYTFPRRASEEQARLGLSVSRKVGGAIDRNLVKRLLREAFDAEAQSVPAGHDVVVVARPSALELAEREGSRACAARCASCSSGRARHEAAVRLVQAPIIAYRRMISPALPRRCKYEPTCSACAVQALQEFGILRGLVLARGACCAATPSVTGATTRSTPSTCSRRPLAPR